MSSSWSWRVLRVSGLSWVAATLILLVTAFGVAAALSGEANESQALLREETESAAAAETSDVSAVLPFVSSLATEALLTDASPADFTSQARAFAGSGLDVVLAHQVGTGFEVVAGEGIPVGSDLSAAFVPTLDGAGASLSITAVLHQGPDSVIGLVLGPPAVPEGYAVFVEQAVPRFISPEARAVKAFAQVKLAIYASAHPSPATLIEATTRALPLTGQLASATIPVGRARYTLVASPRGPLVDTATRVAPWLRAVAGVLLAVAIAVTIEVVIRRERYATRVASERTAELEASRGALVRSERLSAVGEMAAVVGHELRNPLSAALNAVYLAGQSAGDSGDRLAQHLATAEREIGRATNLSEDLTSYMRERRPVFTHLLLDQIVGEVLASAPPPSGVVVSGPAPGIEIDADRDQLTQVLVNLVTNAYQAMPDGGSVAVSGENVNGHTEILVQDTGAGLLSEVEGRFFEPFVTTKAMGTGLGLAIVKRIVENHHGTVAIENAPDGGARVTVHLPRRQVPQPS